MLWRPLRPAVWTAAVLLLSAFICGAARGHFVWPANAKSPIREWVTQPEASAALLEANEPLVPGYFQSFVHMDANQGFDKEAIAARSLANISCTLYSRQRFEPSSRYSVGRDYWSCAGLCKLIELDWSFDKVVTLRRLLSAPGLWVDTPAVLWVGQDSWSVLDAVDLTKYFERGRQHFDICYGTPLYNVGPIGAATLAVRAAKNLVVHRQGFDAIRVVRALASMAQAPTGVGVERLHLSMDDNRWQGKDRTSRPPKLTRQGRFLPPDVFEAFATMLVRSPLLRELSISWDAAQATSDTVRNVEAVAEALTWGTSVRQLSIIRSCSGSPTLVDPLAALFAAANVRGDCRSVETLYYMVHRCPGEDDSASAELEALHSLVQRMPALRRVHLAYPQETLGHKDFPTASQLAWIVPDGVAVTVSTTAQGFAGVTRAETLAPVRGASSDGYAVVVGGPIGPWRESPTVQLELVGNKIPLKTTALTVLVPGWVSLLIEGRIKRTRNTWPDNIAEIVPNLERLAIDSRWTGQRHANDFFEQVPNEIAARLRALMVHTIELRDEYHETAGFDDLLRILEAGRDISVVDLGFSTWTPIYVADGERIERLAATMSRMPRLENVTLTFVTYGYWDFEGAILPCRPDVNVGTLCDMFKSSLRLEHTTVICRAEQRPADHELRVRDHFPVWNNLLLRVPPTPAFASPRDFYNFW